MIYTNFKDSIHVDCYLISQEKCVNVVVFFWVSLKLSYMKRYHEFNPNIFIHKDLYEVICVLAD